ncbi:DNA-3-methyladenine glycosylase [Clostridium thermopalmarium]|uniref:Putative 3-methyladenine DNA glycosylase n=1 Tax=Clostridium thermopalmarium DSM 5974 TaxID=1121340 RepID=A0A2T0AZQ5_9CLOT|nr:DNA-3-methyladenine glycosylase [Clostridium thermopalmarium]PRR76709.1 3-methyladenine DNA glycosylase [Clostridium thermopalmarium DSM 5974]PVZ23044.1 DNA-3-methyladenine glycosylase [Clostridium thermopalmarium DSM 5974]
MKKLERNFYKRSAIEVAKELLGKYLVHEYKGNKLIGRIVEVEAYMGIEDKAAHSYGGRRTVRTEVMYKEGGYTYVFQIYGMYYCVNVVTSEMDIPQAVLIRALEPIEGLEEMSRNRYKKSYEELTAYQKKNLTNGPGKLCMAMNIDKTLNGEDLCGSRLYILDNKEKFNTVYSKRINIDYAEEAKDYLWRFYIEGSKYISKK